MDEHSVAACSEPSSCLFWSQIANQCSGACHHSSLIAPQEIKKVTILKFSTRITSPCPAAQAAWPVSVHANRTHPLYNICYIIHFKWYRRILTLMLYSILILETWNPFIVNRQQRLVLFFESAFLILTSFTTSCLAILAALCAKTTSPDLINSISIVQ
jgi:hypothetical protein